ncbi:MAG: hypothetical protein LBE57_05925 [Methanosarcinales archaeon]|nr:hypothetical protein [Methanosarcinales archaeon]
MPIGKQFEFATRGRFKFAVGMEFIEKPLRDFRFPSGAKRRAGYAACGLLRFSLKCQKCVTLSFKKQKEKTD